MESMILVHLCAIRQGWSKFLGPLWDGRRLWSSSDRLNAPVSEPFGGVRSELFLLHEARDN